MPCYHPVRVGIKRLPAFPGGPRTLDRQKVPCGKCLGCRAEQGRQWAIRLYHETQVTEPAYFLTLTLNDDSIPHSGSLDPAHPRNFLKRLRRRKGKGIKYYLCGEYGEDKGRPHYHAILLGCDFADRVDHPSRESVWRSDELDDIWTHGHTEFSAVTWASASYVTGYVRKKLEWQDPDNYLRYDPDTGELFELEREFARMSRRPAIGLSWLARYWRDVYPRDHVTINGTQCKPPRYYDRALVDPKHDHLFDNDLREREEILYEVKQQRWNENPLDSEQLLNMEANHKARIGLFSKRDKF